MAKEKKEISKEKEIGKENNKKEFIIITINGGAGKNVLATAFTKAVKNNYPESNIIVLTHYKDVWMFNPDIYRVYLFGNAPHFYEDFIKDKNSRVFALEPYSTNDYIHKNKSLIEIWCDLYGIKYNSELPELYFNQREVEFVKNNIIGNTKILLIQTNGGGQQDTKISWMRDLPSSTAQEVVEYFRDKFRIIHIRRQDQPQLHGVDVFQGGLRELFLLIRFSEKRLFIDSVCQHASVAVGKEATVVWVRNNPEVLGYSMHDNIVTKVEDELNVFSNSVLEPYDITGNIYQCPFKEDTKLFDSEEIITSIMNQKNEPKRLKKIPKE